MPRFTDDDHNSTEKDLENEDVGLEEVESEKSDPPEQKEENLNIEENLRPEKKGVDRTFVLLLGAAVLTAIFFVSYFSGFFDSGDYLNISLQNFITAYEKTSGYKAISDQGFYFSETMLQPGNPGEDASFVAAVENDLSYEMYLQGISDIKRNNVRQISVSLVSPEAVNSETITDKLSIFVPYVQVLCPDLSVQAAEIFLTELYEAENEGMQRSRFQFAFITQQAGEQNVMTLYLSGVV